jgi:hypothetical protein
VIKKFLFAFVVLALSLQGFTAVAMPFCQHQAGAIDRAMGQDSEEHAHHALATANESLSAMGGFACDDCAFCQLCAAPAIPAVALISLPEAAPSLITTPPVYFSLFVPEQPQPPPLSQSV